MKMLFTMLALFAGAAGAQDFYQQSSGGGQTPVHEINVGPFVGSSYLGVNLAEIDPNRAKELKLKEDYGVEISRVEDNSPAEKAGIKAGDVVLEYNGQRVEGMEQFGRLVKETPPGREVKLTVSRNGALQTLTAVVGSRKYHFAVNLPPIEIPEIPPMPDIPQIFTATRSARLGVEAETLGPQLAIYFGVKEGVLVRAVLDNTPAQKAGFKAGDVITKVDGTAVTAPSELSSAVRAASAKKTYSVELMRDHKPVTLTVTVDERSDRYTPGVRVVSNPN
jgi:serine protease Do